MSNILKFQMHVELMLHGGNCETSGLKGKGVIGLTHRTIL